MCLNIGIHTVRGPARLVTRPKGGHRDLDSLVGPRGGCRCNWLRVQSDTVRIYFGHPTDGDAVIAFDGTTQIESPSPRLV